MHLCKLSEMEETIKLLLKEVNRRIRKPTQLGTHSCKLSEMEEIIKLLLKKVNRRIRKPTQLGTHLCKLSEMEETIKTNIEINKSTNQKTYPTRNALM